jgi:hypothetical protein
VVDEHATGEAGLLLRGVGARGPGVGAGGGSGDGVSADLGRVPGGGAEGDGRAWFRQEYLCGFEDVVSTVFRREDVERAFTDEVEPLEL